MTKAYDSAYTLNKGVISEIEERIEIDVYLCDTVNKMNKIMKLIEQQKTRDEDDIEGYIEDSLFLLESFSANKYEPGGSVEGYVAILILNSPFKTTVGFVRCRDGVWEAEITSPKNVMLLNWAGEPPSTDITKALSGFDHFVTEELECDLDHSIWLESQLS